MSTWELSKVPRPMPRINPIEGLIDCIQSDTCVGNQVGQPSQEPPDIPADIQFVGMGIRATAGDEFVNPGVWSGLARLSLTTWKRPYQSKPSVLDDPFGIGSPRLVLCQPIQDRPASCRHRIAPCLLSSLSTADFTVSTAAPRTPNQFVAAD